MCFDNNARQRAFWHHVSTYPWLIRPDPFNNLVRAVPLRFGHSLKLVLNALTFLEDQERSITLVTGVIKRLHEIFNRAAVR